MGMWNGILTKLHLSPKPIASTGAPARVVALPHFKVGDFATKPSPDYNSQILLRRLDFSEENLNRPDFDPIQSVTTAIESWPNIRPSDRPGDPRRLAVPFQHVIIQASDHENYGSFANDLSKELERRFGHLVDEFYVQVVPSTSRARGDMRVFFGLGVYYPNLLTPRVGTVQFRYSQERPEKTSPGIRPKIGGQDACWFEGQGGLCIGFRPGLAPATLNLEDAGVPLSVAEQLEDVVLFLGRENETARSEIRMVPWDSSRATSKLTLTDPQVEWHRTTHQMRRDRAGNEWTVEEPWREIQVNGVKLWLRYEPHTGASGFTTQRPEPIPKSELNTGPRPHWISVVGLVMPSRAGFLSRRASWWIDFDANGDLRHREPTGRRLSLVQSGKGRRFPLLGPSADDDLSLFDHEKCDWRFPTGEVAGEPSIRFRPGMTLHRYRRAPIDLVRSPGESLGAFTQENATRQALRAIYGEEVAVVGFREPMAVFGYLPLRPDHRYVVKGEPVEPRFLQTVGATTPGGQLSLDWLNRAAGVGLRSPVGLASHWLAKIEELEIVIKAGGVLHINCKAADQGGQVLPIALPPNGAFGLLGPLFIRYDGPDDNA